MHALVCVCVCVCVVVAVVDMPDFLLAHCQLVEGY
jgi:hypothetical protein